MRVVNVATESKASFRQSSVTAVTGSVLLHFQPFPHEGTGRSTGKELAGGLIRLRTLCGFPPRVDPEASPAPDVSAIRAGAK